MILRCSGTLLIAVLTTVGSGDVRGDLVLLSTNVPTVGAPLELLAGGDAGEMHVTVTNNVNSGDAPADRMAGWMLKVRIVKDAGATGTVTIQSPITGTATNPDDYVFDPPPNAGITVDSDGTELVAFDLADPFNSVQLTTIPLRLLTLSLTASADATGTFGLEAVGGLAASHWTGGNPPPAINPEREFVGLSFGGTLRIGEIQVAIPEPSSVLLVGMVVVFGVIRVLCSEVTHKLQCAKQASQ